MYLDNLQVSDKRGLCVAGRFLQALEGGLTLFPQTLTTVKHIWKSNFCNLDWNVKNDLIGKKK